MSYKEWLYNQLVDEEIIDEFDYEDADEVSRTVLLTETELEEDDLDNLENQFVEYCRTHGEQPIMDLDD